MKIVEGKMWRKHFTSEVLKKAQKYFEAGLVDDFKSSKSHVSAVVGEYNVCIDFKDSQIISMYCDCRQRNCIHRQPYYIILKIILKRIIPV